MPRYYCDYCDVYLTHDSISVRKDHNTGRAHISNVRDWYAKYLPPVTGLPPFPPGVRPPPFMPPPPGQPGAQAVRPSFPFPVGMPPGMPPGWRPPPNAAGMPNPGALSSPSAQSYNYPAPPPPSGPSANSSQQH